MNWTHVLFIGALVAGLAGCGGRSAPVMPPGSRVIMSGETPTYALCDKGHLLFVTGAGQIQVVPLGCLDGKP
ncbi:MAG TPA: hypothetical protein VJ301_18895 [Propionibacteriaceae bacterium]|nr:hypothetical protein [Propionibacteriaceae bacterium]